MVYKKAGAHIEIILAFIIFFSVIGFALYFFSPLKSSRIVDSTLDYAFAEIIKNVSVDIDTYTVIINAGEGINAGEVAQLEIEGEEGNKNVRVTDDSGDVMLSKRSDDFVSFVWGGEKLVLIEFSEDFVDSDLSLDTPKSGSYYQIASSKTRRAISEKRVIKLNESYYTNYLGLKEDFNLPRRVDFAFLLILNNGDEIEASIQTPGEREVFSNSKRMEILRQADETSDFAELTVRVW